MALCQDCELLTFRGNKPYCRYYKVERPKKSKCNKYHKDDYIDTSASYKKFPHKN